MMDTGDIYRATWMFIFMKWNSVPIGINYISR